MRRGTYVLRASVQEAAATALAAMSQTMRSVPDNLERKLGLAPEVAAEVGAAIDAALNEVANQFESMYEGAHKDVDAD